MLTKNTFSFLNLQQQKGYKQAQLTSNCLETILNQIQIQQSINPIDLSEIKQAQCIANITASQFNNQNSLIEQKIIRMFQQLKKMMKNIMSRTNLTESMFQLFQSFKDFVLGLQSDISPDKLLPQTAYTLSNLNIKLQKIRNKNVLDSLEIQPISKDRQQGQFNQNQKSKLMAFLPQPSIQNKIKDVLRQKYPMKFEPLRFSTSPSKTQRKNLNILLNQQIEEATGCQDKQDDQRSPYSPRRLFGTYLSPRANNQGSLASVWNETTAMISSPRSMANLHELRQTFKNCLKRTKICAKLNNRCKHYSKLSECHQANNNRFIDLRR